MTAISWKDAADELHINVERTLSSIRAELFNWEHHSAAGLIADTHTMLDNRASKDKEVIPKIDIAFEEISDLLEKIEEEERKQELWLQGLERMIYQLQHVSDAVQTERESYRERITRNESELESAPLWRKMYLDLKQRYYEDLRKHVDETEIRITLESTVSISFLHPDPCQQLPESVPGGRIRLKASGNLAQIAETLSSITLESMGRSAAELRIELQLRNPRVPELNQSEATKAV